MIGNADVLDDGDWEAFPDDLLTSAGQFIPTINAEDRSGDISVFVYTSFRETSVAIISSGGMGPYILDLIAKTPVGEIHLLDSDDINWHNFMHVPGAPTEKEILRIRERKSQDRHSLLKMDYYHSRYAPLREGIHLHRFCEYPKTCSNLLPSSQGREMFHRQRIEGGTGIEVFFCDPRSPWQHPSDEHNNALIRRWLPTHYEHRKEGKDGYR